MFMTLAKKNPKHNAWLTNSAFAFLGLAVVIVTVVASVPKWRDSVRSWVQSPYRTILAKTRGDLTGQGFVVSVIKIKTQEGISVEIFERSEDSDQERLLSRLKFEERRDGHFSIRGQATNLAMMDVDGDGVLEIIVPVYDENLIPRLHVFKFDPMGKVFIRMGPESVHF